MNPEELTTAYENLKKEVEEIRRTSTNKADFENLQNIIKKQSFSGLQVYNTPVRISASISAQAGGMAALYVGSGQLGVYYGSGAPSATAGQGSLYLRSDGASVSTRAYINTDGGTTWTGITTTG